DMEHRLSRFIAGYDLMIGDDAVNQDLRQHTDNHHDDDAARRIEQAAEQQPVIQQRILAQAEGHLEAIKVLVPVGDFQVDQGIHYWIGRRERHSRADEQLQSYTKVGHRLNSLWQRDTQAATDLVSQFLWP